MWCIVAISTLGCRGTSSTSSRHNRRNAMRSLSIIVDTALRWRARSTPLTNADCSSSADGPSIDPRSTETRLFMQVRDPASGGGTHVYSASVGDAVIVSTRSPASASARSLNATTKLSVCGRGVTGGGSMSTVSERDRESFVPANIAPSYSAASTPDKSWLFQHRCPVQGLSMWLRTLFRHHGWANPHRRSARNGRAVGAAKVCVDGELGCGGGQDACVSAQTRAISRTSHTASLVSGYGR